jgi:KUP system potassium uptake protein
MLKFFQGGWVPLLLGALVYLIITTWNKGRKILRQKLQERTQPLDEFIEEFLSSRLMSISGTAIYMYSSVDGTPPALAQNLKHNKILHKQILILSFLFHGVPRIKEDQRLGIENPLENFYRIKVNYGFMEQANIYEVIKKINESGIKVDIEKSTFYLGREIIIPGAKAGMSTWREKIFVFLSHNSQKATEYFNLPHDRVFEVGTQVII